MKKSEKYVERIAHKDTWTDTQGKTFIQVRIFRETQTILFQCIKGILFFSHYVILCKILLFTIYNALPFVPQKLFLQAQLLILIQRYKELWYHIIHIYWGTTRGRALWCCDTLLEGTHKSFSLYMTYQKPFWSGSRYVFYFFFSP